MIYFKKLGNMGRMGNQLFQYAALKGLCLRHGYRAVIPDLNNRMCHGQRPLLTKLNINADVYNGEPLRHKMKEGSWRAVDRRFGRLRDNTVIEGYFQSIYYFSDYQDVIKMELTPRGEYLDRARGFVDSLRRKHGRPVISVHLRRGDNVTEPHSRIKYAPPYDEDGMYFDYFIKARSVFRHVDATYLVFTGGARGGEDNSKDMAWCKDVFIGDEYEFSEGQDQIDDFARIMSCNHNILSHVSSFGWWAAYLNGNPDRITVAPESYHPEEPHLKRYMFYPKEYVLV